MVAANADGVHHETGTKEQFVWLALTCEVDIGMLRKLLQYNSQCNGSGCSTGSSKNYNFPTG